MVFHSQAVVRPDIERDLHALAERGDALASLPDEGAGHTRCGADEHGLQLVVGREPTQLPLDLECDGEGPPHAAEAGAAGAGLGEEPDQTLAAPFAGHLDETQGAEVKDLGLLAIALEGLLECLHHSLAVAGAIHVDEVDYDDASDIAQAELAGDLVGGLEVGAKNGIGEAGGAGVAAGVHVDGGEGLCLVDADVTSGLEPNAPAEEAVNLALDVVLVENGELAAIALDAPPQTRCDEPDQLNRAVIDALGVDDECLHIVGEGIADDLVGEGQILVQKRRCFGGGCLLHDAVTQVHEHFQVGRKVLLAASLGLGAHDDASALGVDPFADFAEAVPFLPVLNLAGDAHLGCFGQHDDQIAARQSEAGGGAGALPGNRGAHDLDDDLLALLQPL